MHLSDTLVLGPLPLLGRSLRLPLGAVTAGLPALPFAGAAAALVALGDEASDRRGEGLLLAAVRRAWLKPVASPGEHQLATTAFREVAGLRAGGQP